MYLRQSGWANQTCVSIRRVVFVVSLLIACLVLSFHASANQPLLVPVDRDLPTFDLEGANGEVWNNDALQGKPWLINFWAVWCAPCLDELPALNETWSVLKEKNVGMLAVNIGDDADSIKLFLHKHDLKIDFPIVIGDKYKTLGNWSAITLPYTVIVSPEGKIVYEASGPREWADPFFIDAITGLLDS